MEKLENYRDLVKKLINKYGQYKPKYGDINELVEWGVPKEDIVLAYHAPYKRQYTGFAVD